MAEQTTIEMRPPKILPPHYLLMALVLMIGTLWLPLPELILAPWHWIGAVLVLDGLFIAGWAARQFSLADTNIIPLSQSSTLVTHGMFSFTRNPMYLGMLSLLIGVAILVNNWLAFLVIPVFYLIIRNLFIAREEKLMRSTFTEEYEAYCEKVRRWI